MSGMRNSVGGGTMRRLFSIALVGLALTTVASDASAQGRGRARGGRPGTRTADSAAVRRLDSLRTARTRGGQDSIRAGRGRGRPGADSLSRRPDSLAARVGRGARPGDIANARGALAGLKLNESEKADVKTITQKYAEELKQLRQKAGKGGLGQDAELRAEIQSLAEKERAEIRAALTAPNQIQFDANVARGRGGRGRGPDRPPVR
jgi:hypothetical protein